MFLTLFDMRISGQSIVELHHMAIRLIELHPSKLDSMNDVVGRALLPFFLANQFRLKSLPFRFNVFLCVFVLSVLFIFYFFFISFYLFLISLKI